MRQFPVWIVLLVLLVGCGLETRLQAEPGPFPSQIAVEPTTTATAPTIAFQATSTLSPTPLASVTPIPIKPTTTSEPKLPASPSPEPDFNLEAGEVPLRHSLNDDDSYFWALIGDSVDHLDAERDAGIEAKVFSLSWRLYEPADAQWSQSYIARKTAQYRQIRSAGLEVILSIGYHDPPDWIHDAYVDSRYVNQFGDAYVSQDRIDGGDLNIVWNQAMRSLVERYTAHVFATLGTDFVAVRIGGGRFGELGYPPASFGAHGNNYWAFDESALASNPVPGWRPGDPGDGDEAARFLDWYLDALVDFQNWQVAMLRDVYNGPLMILYPSWGLRPGDVAMALETNLDGSSAPELNGEVQRGYDFARQVAALSDPGIILTTTWLDADVYPDSEYGDDPRFWSPARYLAFLAARHPLRLPLYGENTGQGGVSEMTLSARRMRENGLLGMAWYRESELVSPEYASLDDYRLLIQSTDDAADAAR